MDILPIAENMIYRDDTRLSKNRLRVIFRSVGVFERNEIDVFERITIQALGLLILFFGVATEGYSEPEHKIPEPAADVRVLIDVSGSMKHNDPSNIRIPALKLLVNLLPPDSRVGVWLFSSETVPLVPVDKVNEDWKAKALKSASGIHSRGLFTNIEAALDAASEGWRADSQTSRKSIILLTDGVVDVSKDPKASAASRSAILEKVVPRLQRSSAQVHTIALSENADHELLKKLSFDTGGWNRSVQSAEQLERIFLAMFKKAVHRDSVPLTGNKFTIDAGIDEFSALVFRKVGAQPTRLIGPDNIEISQESQIDNVRWHHEASYDLITVKQPVTGDWQLMADLDPDNQVMVVTDLKLNMSEVPNYVSENEPVEFTVRFTEQGETLVNADFLKLIELRLEQSDDLGRKRDWTFSADPAEAGNFTQTIAETLVPGRHTFKIVANGRTFQREVEHRIEVAEKAVDIEITPSGDPESNAVRIQLIPDADIFDMLSLNVVASVTDHTGEEGKFDLSHSNGIRELIVEIPPPDQRTIVNFSMTAKTLRGNIVHPAIRPIVVDRHILETLTEKEQSDAGQDTWDDGEPGEPDSLTISQEPDWMMTGVIAAIVNFVLLLGGFFLYRYVQKRMTKQQTQLIDRLAT